MAITPLIKEITVDSELSTTSTNPVQNKVIAEALGVGTLFRHTCGFTNADNTVKGYFEFLSKSSSNTEYLNKLLYDIGAVDIDSAVVAQGRSNVVDRPIIVGVYAGGSLDTNSLNVVTSNYDYTSWRQEFAVIGTEITFVRSVTPIL